VALLGALETALHGGHGSSARKDGDAIFSGHFRDVSDDNLTEVHLFRVLTATSSSVIKSCDSCSDIYGPL
jgi:hypothetical protein